MPKLIGTRRPVGIPGRLLWVASIIVMMGTLPKTAGAQSSQRNDEPPLTDRERGLLERIQNLEKQLAQLRDVQVRLATIEAKLGESSTRPGAQCQGRSKTRPLERRKSRPVPGWWRLCLKDLRGRLERRPATRLAGRV